MMHIARSGLSVVLALSLVAPAFAEESGKKNKDIACVKSAVETRENAIQDAFAVFSSSVTSALTARESALLAAWSNSDASARKTAIKDAWKAYKQSLVSARKALRTARKNAWKTFRDAAKGCPGTMEEGMGENADQL